jgi:hypothetical protein
MFRVFACGSAAGLLLSLLVILGCNKKSETDANGNTVPTSSARDEPPEYSGNHGGTDCKFVFGWAWDKKHPEQTVKVDVYDGDKVIATIPADVFRNDLVTAKIGDGKHGIAFKVPDTLRDGKEHTIRLRIAGTNKDLGNTPKKITCPTKETPAGKPKGK